MIAQKLKPVMSQFEATRPSEVTPFGLDNTIPSLESYCERFNMDMLNALTIAQKILVLHKAGDRTFPLNNEFNISVHSDSIIFKVSD